MAAALLYKTQAAADKERGTQGEQEGRCWGRGGKGEVVNTAYALGPLEHEGIAASEGSVESSRVMAGRQTSQAHESLSPKWQNTCRNHRTIHGCWLLFSHQYEVLACVTVWHSLLRTVWVTVLASGVNWFSALSQNHDSNFLSSI